MNPPEAIAVFAFTILLAGLGGLKLGQPGLETPLYLLAFFQRKTKIAESSPFDNAFDTGNLKTLRNAVHANKLDPDVHLQLR